MDRKRGRDFAHTSVPTVRKPDLRKRRTNDNSTVLDTLPDLLETMVCENDLHGLKLNFFVQYGFSMQSYEDIYDFLSYMSEIDTPASYRISFHYNTFTEEMLHKLSNILRKFHPPGGFAFFSNKFETTIPENFLDGLDYYFLFDIQDNTFGKEFPPKLFSHLENMRVQILDNKYTIPDPITGNKRVPNQTIN